MSNNTDDWSSAEALATEYVRKEKHAGDPVELFRFEATPFLFGVQWPGGEDYVLVYDGHVQTARGLPALPAYFTFLGESRLRALTAGLLDRLLQIMEASSSAVGPVWRPGVAAYQDLLPAIVEANGVLRYVVHSFETGPDQPPRPGTKPAGPLVFHRWSLQLFPVVANVNWKHEERFERPTPPIVTP